MNRHSRTIRALAAALSALAGFVDAIGFISTGGFFVSFMSGNTTRLGVGLAAGSREAAIAAALIALFVAGVVLGSLVGRRTKHRRVAVLLLLALLLSIAAAFGSAQLTLPSLVAVALAMGAENTVFERDHELPVGLTYMTGTLVKAGQRIASALSGGERWAWLPFLWHWFALAAGAALGALAYPRIGLGGLWIAALLAGALALVALGLDRNPAATQP